MTAASISTLSEYRDGLQALLRLATARIDIFDSDLADCGLETHDSIAGLSTLLSDAPDLAMRILVHDSRHIEQNCPRLLALCRLRSGQIRIHTTAPHHRNWSRPFAHADGLHLLTRFHLDSPRGKLCRNDPAETAGYAAQFETLFQASIPGPDGAFLGI